MIHYESGKTFEGLGGILYQAAVLCGLGKEVFLYTKIGQKLILEAEKIIREWPTLHRQGLCLVPGDGNQVHLLYPEKGERVEMLISVVPPLNPDPVIQDLPHFGMLVLVINSGFDVGIEGWRKIVEQAECPLWLDIHSLPLAKKLNVSREYLPLMDWEDWVEGIHYLQANQKETASMLGHPDKLPTEKEIEHFGDRAFEIGVEVVFITQGKEGVLVMIPDERKKISFLGVKRVVDSTGCGDVFCAGTVAKLAEGCDPFESASFGLRLAAEAVGLSGVKEIYALGMRSRER